MCFYILGKGEEFRDLDKMMKRMEHWAHRLYPKLPFDDVMARISQLGKKKNVQVRRVLFSPTLRFGAQIQYYSSLKTVDFIKLNFLMP